MLTDQAALARHVLIESLQSSLETSGVAKEDGHTIEHLLATKAPPSELDALTELGQDPLLLEMRRKQDHFSEPERRTGSKLGRDLDINRGSDDTGQLVAQPVGFSSSRGSKSLTAMHIKVKLSSSLLRWIATVTEPSFGILGGNGEKSLSESLLQSLWGACSYMT